MRRSQSVVLLLLLAGSALLFLSAGRVWGHAQVPVGLRRGYATVDVPGSTLAGGTSAFALGVLAATGALLASRGVARTVLGVLITLVGAGAALDIAFGVADRSDLAGTLPLIQALGDSALDSPDVTLAAWPWLALLGALLACAAGVVTVATARSWGALGRRYEAPGARPAPRDPEVAAWDALDRGEDPTSV